MKSLSAPPALPPHQLARPFFTVIIPTYQRYNETLRALHSVYAQTYKNFELIVIDDHSTPPFNTCPLFKQHFQPCPNPAPVKVFPLSTPLPLNRKNTLTQLLFPQHAPAFNVETYTYLPPQQLQKQPLSPTQQPKQVNPPANNIATVTKSTSPSKSPLSLPLLTLVSLKENKGVASARNLGAELSQGKWLAFLDSDDTWQPQKLTLQHAFIQHNPQYKIIQTNEIWIRDHKRVNPRAIHHKKAGNLFSASLENCLITPSAVALTRKLFCAMDGFYEKLPVCEDYELWLRITASYPIGLLQKPLVTRYQQSRKTFTAYPLASSRPPPSAPQQLSLAYPVMDRFRIIALKRFITTYYDYHNSPRPHLAKTQRTLACRTLLKKCHIVRHGAYKRRHILSTLKWSAYLWWGKIYLKYNKMTPPTST